MSPQHAERWAIQRISGESSYRRKFTVTSGTGFLSATLVCRFLGLTGQDWTGMLFMVTAYTAVMYFVAGALWHRNEAEYLKRSAGA